MQISRLFTRTLTIAGLLFICIAAQAQSTPEAAVQTFLEGFNSGDTAKSASISSRFGTSIVDEFAPYTWNGVKGFDEWGAAFDANSKVLGITEPHVTLSSPIVKNVTAGRAYLIYPSLYTYKLKDVPMREAAHIAIVLRKEAAAWKITAWTWTGTVPKAVK